MQNAAAVNPDEVVLNPSPETKTEEVKPKVPPFSVPNRSRAERIAKILYGPTARAWINRTIASETSPGTTDGGGDVQIVTKTLGVEIGIEKGAYKKVLTVGRDFTEALRLPVETYVKGGFGYAETKKRLQAIGANVPVFEFVEPALKQFPEYELELKAFRESRDPKKKLNEMLRKGALLAAAAAAKEHRVQASIIGGQ